MDRRIESPSAAVLRPGAGARSGVRRGAGRGAAALLFLTHSPDTVALARAAIAKALALAPNLGEAHAARAKLLFEHDWNWEGAEREFHRAIELNANDADAHHHYSHLLLALGRVPEARHEAELMLALDPLAPASCNAPTSPLPLGDGSCCDRRSIARAGSEPTSIP